MVDKETISNIFEKSIQIVKCHDYPKAQALLYWEKHKQDFQTEDYGGMETETLPSPVGVLQRVQAKLQDNVDYTSIERGVAKCYSTNSYIPLGMMLNNIPNWEDQANDWVISYDFGNGFALPVLDSPNNDGNGKWVDLTMPQQSEILSTMIDKSPRVAVDTTVFRYGELPLDIGVGEHGTIKSFMSTSYNPFIAFKDIPEGGAWAQVEADKRYKMTVHVMEGTKGMVLNRHTGCMDWQSELLLDKGMKYIVLDKNDDDMTAEILLY